jgi:hypothetical protein
MPHCQCSAKRLPLSVTKITCFGPHVPDSISALPLVNGIHETGGSSALGSGGTGLRQPVKENLPLIAISSYHSRDTGAVPPTVTSGAGQIIGGKDGHQRCADT